MARAAVPEARNKADGEITAVQSHPAPARSPLAWEHINLAGSHRAITLGTAISGWPKAASDLFEREGSPCALGFLHVDLASKYYEIGSPLFPKVTVGLPGKQSGAFTILANHVSDVNKYIQSAKLNGKPLNVPRFRQVDMIPGGSLILEMGPTPNLSWGTKGH
jgi:hypothetical protein